MDTLELILGLITLALQWRLTLCIACASIAAYLMASHLPFVSGLQGIALAAAGIVPGAMWEASARGTPTSSAPTAPYVERFALAILSFAWGGASGPNMGSLLFGTALLIAAVLCHLRCKPSKDQAGHALLALLISFAAFFSGAAMAHDYFFKSESTPLAGRRAPT